MELTRMHGEESFVTQCFAFLSHFRQIPIHRHVISQCRRMTEQNYWAFTHEILLQPSSDHRVDALGPVLSVMTTDIVAKPEHVRYEFLTALRHCFQFLSVCLSNPLLSQMARSLLLVLPAPAIHVLSTKGQEVDMPALLALIKTTTSETTFRLACKLVAQVPPSAEAIEFVRLCLRRDLESLSIAMSVFRVVAAHLPELAIERAQRMLRDFRKVERYEFALWLYTEDLGPTIREFRKALTEEYPFVAFESVPEKALTWLQAVPFEEWPIKKSKPFIKGVTELVRKSQIRISVRDIIGLSTMGLMIAVRCYENFDFSAMSRSVKRVDLMDRVKLTQPFGAPRPFTFAMPSDDICDKATAAPQLKRGVIFESEILLTNFMRFSKVPIPRPLVLEIVAKFPTLGELADTFLSSRHMQPISKPPLNLQEIIKQCSMKPKFLKQQCIASRDLEPVVIEFLRMWFIEHLSDLTRPKQWFYFLRFLRIAIGDSESVKLVKNTAEFVSHFLQQVPVTDAPVLMEVTKLLLRVLPWAKVQAIGSKIPAIGTIAFRGTKENDEYFTTEVPSLLIAIAKTPFAHPKPEILKLLEERREKLFANFLVAEEMMLALQSDSSLITRPEGYLTLVLSPTSPLYPKAGNFLKLLFKLPGFSLSDFQPMIDNLWIFGYSVPLSFEVCVWFYEALGSDARYQTQKVQRVQNLFITNQSLVGARIVADVFATAGFADSLSLLFGGLAVLASNFYLAFLIAYRYYRLVDDTRRSRFLTTLRAIAVAFPRKSREKSLFAVAHGLTDCGFLLAVAETSDQNVLDALQREFGQPPVA
jgi:hypothetical protein